MAGRRDALLQFLPRIACLHGRGMESLFISRLIGVVNSRSGWFLPSRVKHPLIPRYRSPAAADSVRSNRLTASTCITRKDAENTVYGDEVFRTAKKNQPVLESLQEWGWWALGPAVIYFFELPSSVHTQVHLKAFDIPDSRIREVGTVRYPVVNATPAIAVSRDGRHLAYTQIDSMEGDIMLVERFR